MSAAHRRSPGDRLIRSGAMRRLMNGMYRYVGLRTCAHLLRPWLRSEGWQTIDDFDGDIRFNCRLDEHMGSEIYWRGAYSRGQLRVLDRLLTPGMTFLDVGANQGEFTLFAAKRLQSGSVHAFEPLTEMYQRLLSNISINRFDNIQAHRLGLYSHADKRALFTAKDRFRDGSYHEGLATLFPTDTRSEKVESVELVSLDEFQESEGIEKIDLIKIDVEGAELHVVRGGWLTLTRCRPIVILEADPRNAEIAGGSLGQLFAMLEEYYSLEIIADNGDTRPLLSTDLERFGNVLCRPR